MSSRNRPRTDSGGQSDAKPCLHCGMTPPAAHKKGCIAPKLQLHAGDPRPSAETLTGWRRTCATAFPRESHDGFCSPVVQRRKKR